MTWRPNAGGVEGGYPAVFGGKTNATYADIVGPVLMRAKRWCGNDASSALQRRRMLFDTSCKDVTMNGVSGGFHWSELEPDKQLGKREQIQSTLL